MKPSFISFADKRYRPALDRIVAQAEQSGFFCSVTAFNETNLDPAFREGYADLLRAGVRGFGYWIWKPQIILQTLQSLPTGATLVYADAGCHVNSRGRNRFNDYMAMLDNSHSGVVAFELDGVTARHPARRYTKEDTFFALLGASSPADGQRIRDLPQIAAGVLILRNDTAVQRLIRRWLDACSDRRLLDDTPSILPNADDFVEHRHDQSNFSILARLYGVELFSHDEQYPAKRLPSGKPDWGSMERFPLLTRRDRGAVLGTRLRAFTAHTARKGRNALGSFRGVTRE